MLLFRVPGRDICWLVDKLRLEFVISIPALPVIRYELIFPRLRSVMFFRSMLSLNQSCKLACSGTQITLRCHGILFVGGMNH